MGDCAMATHVDAVIAALRVALSEAESSDETWWKVGDANRWIRQLPGTGIGRWRHLKLAGDLNREINRERFIGHVRATIVYLEKNRDAFGSTTTMRWWPSRAAPAPSTSEIVEADFSDVTPKRRKTVKLIK